MSHMVSVCGIVRGRLCVSAPGTSVAWGPHSQGLSVHERGHHLHCPPAGPSLPSPTSLAALQRLLVAQQQVHVEGVTVLPEGDPRRVGQVLGTAAMVAYSSGKSGPCGGAEWRKWPGVLPRTVYAPPTPHPSGGHSRPLTLHTAPCNLVSQLAVRQAPSTSTYAQPPGCWGSPSCQLT